MMASAPYRIQVFASDELRDVLREIAHKERISLQRLVIKLLTEKLQEYPEGKALAPPEEC